MTQQAEPELKRMGHRPVIPPRIAGPVPRVAERLIERFKSAFVPDVSDAVGVLYTLDPAIRPLYSPMKRVVGQALTAKVPPGDNLTVHGALGLVQPGDVLVVDWRGYTGGCGTGAGSLSVPIKRGLAGVVADGAWRDVAELRALDFPIFCRGINAFSPPKDRPGEINVPVSCGGVVVRPGDIVVGDEEGICVVPLEWADEVAAALRDYTPHTSLDEWGVERMEALVRQRWGYFTRIASDFGARLGTNGYTDT
jgi:4-hydroxy-4-methyl-2-oxoglutarate aldolase